MIKSNNNFNLHPLLKVTEGNKILDYCNRTRTDEKFIPQLFNKRIVFQSYNSFQQTNYKIGKYIRKFVKMNISTNKINTIGGESYLYSLNHNTLFYTNSKSVLNDYNYNNYNNGHIIDYNNDCINLNPIDTVINLSKLNINLINQINNCSSNKLIIINCHNKDFWKKQKLLSNYKLIIRKKFIDYKLKYFITVNIFIRKSFVSLGGNCSVTYQLKKLNLRNQAYPFDWTNIKLPQIINVFNENFNNYNKLELKKFSTNHNSYIVQNKYGKFAHEVLEKQDLVNFELKLERRIERIQNIKNPTFVRIETFNFKNNYIYTEYWIKLCKIFDKLYDNYSIILLSKYNPKISKINWYYSDFNSDWKCNHINWYKFLVKI